MAQQVEVAIVVNRCFVGPGLSQASCRLDISVSKNVVQLLQRLPPLIARSVRSILQGVGNAEQQIGDRHFRAGRFRETRNRQPERPTGSLKEISEVYHNRCHGALLQQ